MHCKVPPTSRAIRAHGFGLVEIAIALGIISFALLSLLGLMAVGLNASKTAREDTVVASLARNVLANLKTLNYAQLSALGSTNFYFTYDGAATNSASSSAYYECRARILMPSQAMLSRSVDVVLDISKPYRSAQTNGTTFSSSIAEY